MKGFPERDDLITALGRTEFPCKLNGRLAGFSSAVTEENFCWKCLAADFACELCLLQIKKIVGDMQDFPGLMFYGDDYGRMTMPKA